MSTFARIQESYETPIANQHEGGPSKIEYFLLVYLRCTQRDDPQCQIQLRQFMRGVQPTPMIGYMGSVVNFLTQLVGC
ncbi:MAG: hypothetical protein P8M20_10400 [Planctomycetaceae bacterium]|nr:hypothetical protein [Planctomycetaceae bacterium]